jgi:hypothetical protein
MMRTSNEDRKQSKPRRRRPGVVQGIANWWIKRRGFYIVQDNSIEDDGPIVDMTMEDSFEVEVQLSSGRPNTRNSKTVDNDDDEEDFSTMNSPSSISSPPPPPPSSASSSTMPYQQPLSTTNPVPSIVTPTGELTPTRSVSTAASILAFGRQGNASGAPPAPQPRFGRSRTKDSFQGSLESIDSLMESCWDPEDDASLATPVVTNVARSIDFYEHVDFLRVQTQPRKVEVVWAKTAAVVISPATSGTTPSS